MLPALLALFHYLLRFYWDDGIDAVPKYRRFTMDEKKAILRLSPTAYSSSDQKKPVKVRFIKPDDHAALPPSGQETDDQARDLDCEATPIKEPLPLADDEIDTLRLPAVARWSIAQKKSRLWQDTGERPAALSTRDPDREADFFDFDTIPRSKVVLPILDDELEDTLRIPAVDSPYISST